MRCGSPSTAVVTVTSLTVAARYSPSPRPGPSSPRSAGSGCPSRRPPPRRPAPPPGPGRRGSRPPRRRGCRTASTTCGSSTVVATSPVWPPPSPPCTITASAPHAATFSACRRAPMEGITTTPASFSSAMSSREGASAKDATRTPSSMMIRTRSRASAASARRLTPNGASVRDLTSRTAWRSWSRRHRRGGEDAQRARVRGGRDQAGARHPAHAGLHDRMPDADQLRVSAVSMRGRRRGLPRGRAGRPGR